MLRKGNIVRRQQKMGMRGEVKKENEKSCRLCEGIKVGNQCYGW